MAGTPPYTLADSATVRANIVTNAKGNFDDIYNKVDPDACIGGYADLPTRLTADEAAIASAGSGTAYAFAGPTAPTSPVDGMPWGDTSTNPPTLKVYDATNTTWIHGGGNVAPIFLTVWDTNPTESTVDIQDSSAAAKDISGPKFVFPYDSLAILYMQVGVMPFSGYDLQFNASFRVSTADTSKAVVFALHAFSITPPGVQTELTTWSAWTTAQTAAGGSTDAVTINTANTANSWHTISGSDLVVPSSQYSTGDTLFLAFYRHYSDASDTHTGSVEMAQQLSLLPVLA